MVRVHGAQKAINLELNPLRNPALRIHLKLCSDESDDVDWPLYDLHNK